MLRNPTNGELARRVGLPVADTASDESDVVVVGAGPAGLGAAVYAASDGLSVIVSIRAHSVGKPEPVRVSKIISVFRPAFPARRSPAVLTCRRRNSVPG